MLFFSKKKVDTQKRHEIDTVVKRVMAKQFSHVTQRDMSTYEELIIGKNGGLAEHEDELLIICDGHEVFRCNRYEVKIGELMSLNGATISGFDKNENKEKSLVAYYKYYR